MKTAEISVQRLHKVQALTKYTYAIVPVVAGLDKFTYLLTDWDKYISPFFADLIPIDIHTFMWVVGIIEIIAGVLVLVKPHIGGYVVAAWLVCIAINLITTGQYLDVAVRDLVMSVGALALAWLYQPSASGVVADKESKKSTMAEQRY